MANKHDIEATFSAEMLDLSAATCSSQALLEGSAGPGVRVGSTPLHAAVQTGDRAQVERALAGADVADLDALDAFGRTPLLLAAAGKAPELTQLLLQRGADPSIADGSGQTPLHAAAAQGCLQSMRLLLQRDAVNVSAMDANGLTPLGVVRSAVCVCELAAADGALSPDDLPLLLRDRPAVLHQLLDLGVQSDSDGVLRVTYRALRNVGRDCPFEAELVRRVQRSGRWQMLGHPAVELLLDVTRQDTFWMAVISLVFSVAFLAVLCTEVLLDLYDMEEEGITTLKAVLLVFNSARILAQLLKLPFTGITTFQQLRFWPEVITTLLTFPAVLLNDTNKVKRAVHAAVILSGFLELTLVVESIPNWKATRAISTLLHVTRRIVCYLLMYLPILIGFGLAFFVVLKKDMTSRKDSPFRGDVLTMTIAAMVIGNVEVTDFNEHAPESWQGFLVCTVIFILFLVLVPLVMLNMLLALTISDTDKFLSNSSSEYLHHVASMTAVNQRAAFSLHRKLQTLHDKLPGRLFSCVSSMTLCVQWRSALSRQFEADGSSCITLIVNPVATNGKTVRVIAYGSKRNYRVSRSVRHGLDQIVQKRVEAEDGYTEVDLPQPLQLLSGQDSAHREVLLALTGEMQERLAQQLHAMREEMAQQQHAMQKEMVKQLHAMREEMVKQPDTMLERQAKSV